MQGKRRTKLALEEETLVWTCQTDFVSWLNGTMLSSAKKMRARAPLRGQGTEALQQAQNSSAVLLVCAGGCCTVWSSWFFFFSPNEAIIHASIFLLMVRPTVQFAPSPLHSSAKGPSPTPSSPDCWSTVNPSPWLETSPPTLWFTRLSPPPPPPRLMTCRRALATGLQGLQWPPGAPMASRGSNGLQGARQRRFFFALPFFSGGFLGRGPREWVPVSTIFFLLLFFLFSSCFSSFFVVLVFFGAKFVAISGKKCYPRTNDAVMWRWFRLRNGTVRLDTYRQMSYRVWTSPTHSL